MDSAHAAYGFQALSKLVGLAPAMLRMIEELPAIAASGAPVLVIGETGTGKELVARALHYLSRRAASPFVAVNCGALPEALIEDRTLRTRARRLHQRGTAAYRTDPGGRPFFQRVALPMSGSNAIVSPELSK